MTNRWKEWQGRTVDGKFVLRDYLGGSEGSAVFRTRVGGGSAGGGPVRDGEAESKTDAAIKLVLADGPEAESPLRRWEAAITLSHPNLIRILTAGRAAVDGRELVYAVEEFAEENLAQILPARALTAEEARGMLSPVVAALEYVHGKGLVHGAIHPSNILAAGDQVKLSSDDLRPAGEVPRTISLYDAPEVLTAGISPASDVWSLGMTLVEVLTQRVPVWDPARMSPPEVGTSVPEPFRGIAQRCLQLDPAKRCAVREIAGRLEGGTKNRREDPAEGKPVTAVAAGGKPARVGAIAASQKKAAKGPYWLVLAAAIVVIIFLMVRPRPSSGPSEAQPSSTPPQTSPPRASSPQVSPQRAVQTAPVEQPPAHAPSSRAQPGSAQTSATDDIVERVMPQVSPSARRTVSGKLKVRVRVVVDAAGNVTEAKLKDAGPSQYFARVALEAARRWKFAPVPDANRRDWTLLFAFTRARTEMSAARAH